LYVLAADRRLPLSLLKDDTIFWNAAASIPE
jgi:hypothetical protein